MHTNARITISTLLVLAVALTLASLPLGASQNYTTVTTFSTVTTQLTAVTTVTSTGGVGQQTTTQMISANVSETLPATNGTVGCTFYIHDLTGGRQGQNITLTFGSLNPIDIYVLSPAAYQSWLNAGRVCTQVNGALLKELNVSGSASYTVTLPADGNYVILVSNKASNAQAAYTLVISFEQTFAVDVTSYTSVIQSSTQSTTLTETLTQIQEIQGPFSGQTVLLVIVALIIAIVILAFIVFKKRSGSKSVQPQTIQRNADGKKFCTSCGSELQPNVTFCGKCGHTVT